MARDVFVEHPRSFNQQGEPAAPARSIPELISEQATRTPQAVALVHEDTALRYGVLLQCASQLAHELQARGVGPEVRVGICLPRTPELVIGLLGILMAGGGYVPLDLAYPQERLAFLLNDAQAALVLSTTALQERLPATTTPVIMLDTLADTLTQQPTTPPPASYDPAQLAYLIYTSGSTGTPKGVAITHGSAGTFLRWAQSRFSPDDLCGVLAGTSICFDLSIFELFLPLSVGGCVILAENILELPTVAAKHNVTLINGVPSAVSGLLQSEQLPDSVRIVNLAGEPLSQQLAQQVYAHAHVERVFNLYGPSEDTTYSTYALVDRQVDAAPPIGQPIAGTRAYILDPQKEPVSVGATGELYLGGAGLARGYLNRPDLTAEKFLPDPFSQNPGARIYRTGDLARYRPDGAIEFLGRVDHQVKIRGYRIELGEIEAVLRRQPEVRECVVLGREDQPGQKRLVAYVVLEQNKEQTNKEQEKDNETTNSCSLFSVLCSPHELRDALQRELPEYMIPAVFVALEALPLTPTGKIDRQALPPPPDLDQSAPADDRPATEVEQILAQIWAEVLRRDRVGLRSSFFELGGDSILALQIMSRAQQHGLRFSSKQLFEHKTIAALAQVIETSAQATAEQGVVTGAVPLTPIQQRFFGQRLNTHHHYNMSLLLSVNEPITPEALEAATRQLLLHHDALRMRFQPSADGWQQLNAPPDEAIPFSYIDLAALSAAEQTAVIRSQLPVVQSSLNLIDGPLIRIVYFDCGTEQPSRLLLALHHVMIDGVSWRVLLDDLQQASQQYAQAETIQLPPKTTAYRDWATQLLEYAHTPEAGAELEHWLAQPPEAITPLPVDTAVAYEHDLEAQTDTVIVALSEDETRALLQDVPAAYNTQINDILLTALVQAFAQWTGSPSLLFDLEGHGREEVVAGVDISRTVGWFTSIFPVFLSIDPAAALDETIQAVKEQLRRIPQRGIGYGVLRYLGDTTTQDRLQALPQPQINFNYLGQFDQMLAGDSLFKLAPEPLTHNRSPGNPRQYLLEIEGWIVAGRISFTWIYSAQVYRRATVEQLAQAYIAALQQMIAHEQAREAYAYASTSFPEVRLSQSDLDSILSELDASDDDL